MWSPSSELKWADPTILDVSWEKMEHMRNGPILSPATAAFPKSHPSYGAGVMRLASPTELTEAEEAS